MTKTITIPNPKTLEYEKEMVLIPKREYETLIHIKQKGIPEVKLTKRQKQAIRESERELEKGEYFTLNEFENHLARSHSKTRR